MKKTPQNIKLTLSEVDKPMASLAANTHGESKSSSKKSKKQTKECNICFEIFTKSTRAEIICGSCEFSACKVCVRRYLLSTTSDAHCMNCKNAWDREFTQNSVNKSFYNKEYKKHREDLLFESEKARFPETMPAVKAHIECKELKVEMDNLKEERLKLQQALYQIDNKIYNGNNKIRRLKNGEQKAEAAKFVKKCPADGCEGFLSSAWKCQVCKLWVCPHCEQEKGYEKDAEHTCDPNILASAQAIKKETKGCPKCAVPIFKISGCDQMWCTACQVAFSWRTGRIVNGVIHNPHFYEFQRTNGNVIRNPGAVVCGGLPTYMMVRDRCRRFNAISDKYSDNQIKEIVTYISMQENVPSKTYFPPRCYQQLPNNIHRDGIPFIMMAKALIRNNGFGDANSRLSRDFVQKLFYDSMYNTHRKATHFQHTILNVNREWLQRNRNNEDLRIKFITKEIDEKTMKSKLISRGKMIQKKTASLNVYEVFGTVITESVIDMYNTLRELCLEIDFNNPTVMQSCRLIDNFINNYNRITKVRHYCNEQLIKISKIYSQTVHLMSPQLFISSYKYSKKGEMPDWYVKETN